MLILTWNLEFYLYILDSVCYFRYLKQSRFFSKERKKLLVYGPNLSLFWPNQDEFSLEFIVFISSWEHIKRNVYVTENSISHLSQAIFHCCQDLSLETDQKVRPALWSPWLTGAIEVCAGSCLPVVWGCYLPHKEKWRICPLGRQSCLLLWKNLLHSWLISSRNNGVSWVWSVEVMRIQQLQLANPEFIYIQDVPLLIHLGFHW